MLTSPGDGDGAMTLTEIAAIVGLSRERVRQIEAVALRKLKIGLKLRELLGAKLLSSPPWRTRQSTG